MLSSHGLVFNHVLALVAADKQKKKTTVGVKRL